MGTETLKQKNSFLQDVVAGMTAEHKYLSSKYFYDEKGSKIFQEIMRMDEYYLPNCEAEILENRSKNIISSLTHETFDIIELGAGDGTKTIIFLEEAVRAGKKITYIPLDISADILEVNRNHVHESLPDLEVEILAGDYSETLNQLKERDKPCIILFMGSNIGNFRGSKALDFINFVNGFMKKGDYFLLGVDLKKDPLIILPAYTDKAGITKRFNLNLLERINRELGADFDLEKFGHCATYDAHDGAAMSFLISLEDQQVMLGEHEFLFREHEVIHMEVSQKYSLEELDTLAEKTGFTHAEHFLDSKEWFSLSLFRK